MTERKHGRMASARAGVAGGAASAQLKHADSAGPGQRGREVLRVLLLEDRDTDAELVERALRKAGFAYTFERAKGESDFLARLDPPPHVIISDYYVPGCDALHALRLVRNRGLDIPFILVSGVIGEARALEAMRLGATDFLLKDRLGRLGSAVRTALELAALRRKASGARQKVERNESEFREAFDKAAIGMALTTLDGCWLKANAAFAAIIGYTTDELEQRDCASVTHPDDVKEDIDLLGRLVAGKVHISQREQRYIHKQGHAVWVLVTASLIRDGSGKPLYRVLQVIDVTERRQTEARLARANRARKVMAECSRALVQATDEPQFLHEMCRIVVDSGGYKQAWIGLTTDDLKRPVYVAAHAGYGSDVPLPMTAPTLFTSDGYYRGNMAAVVATGEPSIERDILGHPRSPEQRAQALKLGWGSSLTLPLMSEGQIRGGFEFNAGEPDAFDGDEIALLTELADDISFGMSALRARLAREQAERAARENEHRFEQTFDHAAVGMVLSSLDGHYLQVNQRFADMLGFTREELVGKTLLSMAHPGDEAALWQMRRQLLNGEVASVTSERRYVRKDGRMVFVNRTLSLARAAAGEPLYFISVVEDITETKQREERYRAMFDNAAVGITRVDLNGTLVDVNQKFCDLVGYTRDELRGKAIQDVTYRDDFGQGARFRAQLAQGEARSASGEKRFVRKDGAIIWARRTMSTVLDEAGRPQYVISVVEDISERKQAEEALRTSEEVLRATFSQAAVGIYVTTPDASYLQVNDKYCDMLGYTRDELLALSIRDVNRAEDIADVLSNREKLIRGEVTDASRERQLIRKDGSLIWVSHSTSLARDEKGDPLYFITVAEDVTERKELTERYRATFNNAPVGIMHTSIDDDRIVHANSKLCEMLGYTQEQLLRMSTDSLIHPDYVGADRGRYRAKMLKGEVNTFSSERLYKRRDGSNLWVNRTVSLARDTAGRPLYFIRIIEDIGERKRAEQAVASERALLRTIIDSVPDYIYVKDAAGRFQLANKAWLNERNSDGEQIVGKTVFDVFSPPELARTMADQDAAIVKGGAPILDREQPVTLKAPDGKPGQTRWTAITKVPMRDASGEIIGTVGISRDITEQKLSARLRDMEHAVTRMLSEPGSLDQAIRRILQAVCEGLAWACGAYWQWDEATEVLRCVETWHGDVKEVAQFAADTRGRINEPPSWQGRSRFISQTGGLIRTIWQNGAPIWFSDVTQRPDFQRAQIAAKADLHCAFGFPVVAGDKPLGVMEFYGRDIAEPDEALLQMVRAIGSQVGQFIQRKEAEQALRLSEERYRDQFDASPLPMWVWDDKALRFLAVNQAAIEHYGYTRDEFLRMSVRDIWAPDEGARYDENLRDRAREHTLHLQRKHRTKDARIVDVEVTARRFTSGGRNVWLTLVNDISERKRAEAALLESEEQFRQLANNIPQVFWITDVEQKETLYLSPATEELIGRPLQEIREKPRLLIRATHEEDRVRVHAARKTAAVGGYDVTYRIVRPDGTIRWVHDRAFPVRDAAGNAYRIAGIAEDITERKLAEERLMHLAHYDVLTSLPNRMLYYDRLRQALLHAKRNQWIVGVMLIDVDRFKNVNDTLGHAVGDRLLQQVSERLTKAVRAGDTVGRLGGDEFAIVLSNIATVQDGNHVAQKILASFKDPFRLESGSEIYVTASIGITLYPDDSTDQDTLIKNADTAMYRAKDVGRNAYRFYTPEMNARALELLSMESSLRGAIDRREFLIYYQPKASLINGEIVGLEALLRWRHPERGLVSPGEFMPVMEETGLIVPVGEWVVRAVCAQISEWQRAGVDPKSVAINLSARQFVDKDLGTTIKGILAECNIDPQQIEFEITESSLMANTEESIRTLELLGNLGVRLSIDDFGTGYSSLGYLKRFPLDALKIDRSFVRDLTTSTDDATITRAVISMAHSLGLKVIAEGVETEEQLTFLAEHGCDECQGYYFSPPLPADECGRWLTERRALVRPAQALQPGASIVLLVGDDNDALLLFKRALAKDAYRILMASSAREGLELLGKNNVDVIISDQNMPGIAGVEFLRRARSLFPDTIRMMTSAHSDLKEVVDAVDAGEIFRFLPKSLDEGQLRADVRDALRRKGR